MKNLYTFLMAMLVATAANAATTVELTAYPSIYTGRYNPVTDEYIYEDGEDFTVTASIEGNQVTFPNFLETNLDLTAYIFEDTTVGFNITQGYRHTGITVGEYGYYESYYVYNETQDSGYNGFYYFEEEGEKWLIFYTYAYNGSSSSDGDNLEVYFLLPDDFQAGVIGEDIDASAVLSTNNATSLSATITGTIDDDSSNIHISNFLGYPYPIDIVWDEETGKVNTSIPSSWVTGYYTVGSKNYYYIRDFYQGAYSQYGESTFGRYIALYLSLSTGGSNEDLYYVYIYLPSAENQINGEEGQLAVEVYTNYNGEYTSLTVDATVDGNTYFIPGFLDSDLDVTIVADKAAGTVASDLPTGQLKKNFYIGDVKFTYIYGYKASNSEWAKATDGSDYFDLKFMLYSSAVGDWTWVYYNIFPDSFGTDGVSNISVDQSNAPTEIFNLNGMKVGSDNLTPGLYIRRQGTKSSKFIVR